MKFKLILIIVAVFYITQHSYSQFITESNTNYVPEPKMTLKDRLFFGGGFGLQFGSYTNIEISPLVGLKLTPEFQIGAGMSYQFISSDFYDFSTSIYGYRGFSNYLVLSNIFVHAEYESLSLESKYFDYLNRYPNTDRFWVGSFLVGGGYRMMVGERSSVNFMILFNLNETVYSPYSNPIFRLGFYF